MALLRWLEAGRLSAGIALTSVLLSKSAHAAEETPLDLEWRAPLECPEQAAVFDLIEQHLARTGTRTLLERVVAVAQVERSDETWRARLHLEGAVAGERTFEATSCDELAEVVSLVIAMALQSQAPPAAEQAEPEPEPEEEEQEQANDTEEAPVAVIESPPEADEADSTRAAPAASGPRFALGISSMADSATLSRIAIGGAALGLLEWRAIQALIGFGYFPPVRTKVTGHASAEAVFDLAIGRAQGCFAPSLGPASAGPCLSLESGILRGRSEGIRQTETTSTFWLAAETGGAASVRAGPCIVRAEAGALWPLRRPRFMIDGQADAEHEAHQVAQVGWRALIAVFVPL